MEKPLASAASAQLPSPPPAPAPKEILAEQLRVLTAFQRTLEREEKLDGEWNLRAQPVLARLPEARTIVRRIRLTMLLLLSLSLGLISSLIGWRVLDVPPAVSVLFLSAFLFGLALLGLQLRRALAMDAGTVLRLEELYEDTKDRGLLQRPGR